jgi:hypothetical protein
MGRREWLTVFYGTALTLGLIEFVSPGGVQQAIALVAHGIGHLFGTPPPQLGP